MPGGDRTGPMGMGPRTGRAAGYCAGSGVPGYANPATPGGAIRGGQGVGGGQGMRLGRGMGRGRGFGAGRFGGGGGGRGWRNRFYATGLPGWARSDADSTRNAPAVQNPGAGLPVEGLQAQLAALRVEIGDIERRLAAMNPASAPEPEPGDET